MRQQRRRAGATYCTTRLTKNGVIFSQVLWCRLDFHCRRKLCFCRFDTNHDGDNLYELNKPASLNQHFYFIFLFYLTFPDKLRACPRENNMIRRRFCFAGYIFCRALSVRVRCNSSIDICSRFSAARFSCRGCIFCPWLALLAFRRRRLYLTGRSRWTYRQ